MTCPVCGAQRPANPWITGIIFRPYTDIPLAVAYRCTPPCTNNRDIRWEAATREQRQQAYLAQQSRDAASEMMMAPAR
jgi:hypothetical protein